MAASVNAPVAGGGSVSNDGVSVPSIFGSANPATHVLLAVALQAGGLVIAVTVAGISDDAATFILFLMVGLLLLFMIMNADKFSGIVNILTNAETGATE